MLSKNFSRKEMECQCGCGRGNMSDDLIRRLQDIRDDLRMPMKINSAFRCEPHNKKVGGSSKSSHLPDEFGISYAVDIACTTSAYRQKLLEVVFKHCDRVGIAKTFVHIDCDPRKNAEVCWLY